MLAYVTGNVNLFLEIANLASSEELINADVLSVSPPRHPVPHRLLLWHPAVFQTKSTLLKDQANIISSHNALPSS